MHKTDKFEKAVNSKDSNIILKAQVDSAKE